MKPGKRHLSENCQAVSEVLQRVGDKWTVLVVKILGRGPMRFNELKRTIDGISQRMLTLTLRALERDGLVTRTVYPSVPPRVEYELTALGRSLLRRSRRWPCGRSTIAARSTARAPSSTRANPRKRRSRPPRATATRAGCVRPMIIAHDGKPPRIDPAAWVAPDATICGDVEIAAGARVLHGARIVGEAGGKIRIGRNVIVMENAVVRAGPRHPCQIGDHCLIGPHAHVTGCTIEEQVFVATGASIFHGAQVGKGSVSPRQRHRASEDAARSPAPVVPISWIALGDPGRCSRPTSTTELSVVLKRAQFLDDRLRPRSRHSGLA